MKTIAVYVRVSSKAQDAASQLPDLERWAEGKGDVMWYRDKFTGMSMERPAFNRMVKEIGAGKVSTVVIWRLDRLGRTARGLTAFIDDLVKRKVNLISLKDGIDLETPAGRMMANVLASVAQFETEVRAERTLAGQAVARAKGKTWGGGRQGVRLKVQPEQEVIIRRLKSEGESIAAIARTTGLSRPTVYDVLGSQSGAGGTP